MSEYMRGLRERVGTMLVQVPSVTALVLDEEERLLLARVANGGVWVAPGGAIDPDEAPQDAIVREVFEETGLHVEPLRFVGVFGGPEYRVRYANGDEVSYVTSVFECRVLGGTLRPDGEEVLEVGWFSVDEVARLDVSRWARHVLPEVLAHRGEAWVPPVRCRPPGA